MSKIHKITLVPSTTVSLLIIKKLDKEKPFRWLTSSFFVLLHPVFTVENLFNT